MDAQCLVVRIVRLRCDIDSVSVVEGDTREEGSGRDCADDVEQSCDVERYRETN